MDRSGVPSTRGISQRDGSKSFRSSHFRMDCPIDELFEQKFHARCYIFYSISIQLSNREASSIDERPHNMVYFTKEQFAEGTPLPIAFLVKQFFHFSKIPSAFIHSNVIQILMGCSVLDALYQLDLSLLEVLFVCTIKISPKEHFSLSAHILSLQFVIGLPDSNKGWAKWHILVSDPWSGSTKGSNKLFKPTRFLEIPSTFFFFNVIVLTVHRLSMSWSNSYFVCTGKETQGHLVE